MTSQRILLTGGLLLFLLSIGYGLVYDSFIQPAQRQAMLYSLDMALNMAVKGDLAMAGAFATQFGAEQAAETFQARIPLHLALAGAMTTAPLWLDTRLDVSERLKRIFALLIVSGGLLLAAGDFLRAAAPAGFGLYLVLGGYVWLALGLTGYLIYAVLFAWLRPDELRTKRR